MVGRLRRYNSDARRSLRQRMRSLVAVAVVAAVAVLFFVTLRDNWAQVTGRALGWSWWYAVATLLFAMAVPVSGWLWGQIVERMDGQPLTLRDAVAAHNASWLLKYIPGQVGAVTYKLAWGKRRGRPRALMLISFIYEHLFLQVASLVPAVIILLMALGPRLMDGNEQVSVLILATIALVFTALSPPVLGRVLGVASRRVLKSELPRDYVLPARDIAVFSSLYTLPRIVNGVGFLMIVTAVAPTEPRDWLPLMATYAMAGALGILAVFVPSGIGVREAVIFGALVALGYESADAVVVAVIARLASTVGDVLVAAQYAVLRRPPSPKDVT